MPLVFTILKDNVKKKHTEGKVTDVFGERGLKLRLAIAIQLSEQSISWVRDLISEILQEASDGRDNGTIKFLLDCRYSIPY
jgi:hypothetical protein